MNKTVLFNFVADKANNTIRVARSFDAPTSLVWEAWTDAAILDQWWAPKPYRNQTKSMRFEEGGRWHYCMISPAGEVHWCLFDYEKIVPGKSFAGIDAFCTETAEFLPTKPRVRWKNEFTPAESETTVVHIEMYFETLADLEAIIQMGFKEGFSMGLQNLDDYLRARQ